MFTFKFKPFSRFTICLQINITIAKLTKKKMLPLIGLIFIDTKAHAIKKKRWLVKDKIKLTLIKNI